MKTSSLAVLLWLGTAAACAAQANPKVVYGSDDRRDLYQVQDAKTLALADSTVALFRASDVTLQGAQAALNLQPYGQAYNLCKEEPFYDQTVGAFCSGSLVGPDLMMTAGHCVTSQEDCRTVKFVFGYDVKRAGDRPGAVPASEVYGCAQLLGREQQADGADWALVRVDRVVAGHVPLALDRGPGVAKGDPVFVIGHPAGLPTKIAGGANVRDASFNGFFRANLDTYGGNSGSAVFSGKTGLVEGILVRGEADYVYKGQCRVTNVCPNDGCRGEDVTKIGSVGFPIPQAGLPDHVSPLSPALAALLDANAEAVTRQ